MVFLASNGYRTIAHDRRGHGRSSRPSGGNEMDTYADDLATLIEGLDLRDAVLIGYSTGGGEVTRYIGRLLRHPRRRRCRPLAVLQGSHRTVLRCQQAGCQGLPGRPRRLLVSGDAGWSQERV
jgi:non-heme chloroperoxidase